MNANTRKLFTFLNTGRWTDSGMFFLRLFIGIMMLTHGIAKVENFNQLADSFPTPLGWGSRLSFTVVLLVETLGSLCIISGFLLKPAAFVLAFAMFTATFLTFPGSNISANELPFIYMGVFIFFIIAGGGRYSLDKLVFRTKYVNK